MGHDAFLDLPPTDPAWGHGLCSDRHGHRVHYVRHGGGAPVVLLHGWPGLWYDHRRVIPTLGAEVDVVAPDLRGFGASGAPDLPPETGYGREAQARVVLDLMDALEIDRAVLAGYDVGSAVAQTVARLAPGRVRGLVLGAPLHPGSGARALLPVHQREFWYQDFHRLPLAVELVGRDRVSVEAYLGHFYRHWTGRHETVRPAELAAVVDVYAVPGALDASLNWYRSGAGTLETARRAAAEPAPAPPPLPHPTEVLWGERDPLFPPDWAEGLERTLADHRLRVLPGVGHFIPFEAPDALVQAVRSLL
ncbi:MAG TPA: alpha/beta hydrolase [Candidatus Dormibacteraeota bacterium]|jgi:pimeloyl-ACP methyl ester carboxylesterase|nr:alpha/beta hydrolase [Candidatus Dormibacteraeota bacterium]